MKIFLKKNEERRINIGHQWIFSNEIEKIEGEIIDGGVAEIYSNRGSYLGQGLYNKHSLIAMRFLTSTDEAIDKEFFRKRIKTAEQRRMKVHPDRKSFRLCNSESDFLPGLIIDKFDDIFSLQIFSKGVEVFKQDICDILAEDFGAAFIAEKNDSELRTLEGLEKKEGILLGSEENGIRQTEIDGIKYNLNLLKGQKTGFYLDQAFNRLKIRGYVSENSSVLDLFCNEGGFAMNAAFAGCKKITGVDSSGHSIETAKKNSSDNGFDFIKYECRDIFEYFDEQFQSKEKYNLIVLDPPSFTKSRKNIPTAVKGYTELNYKAMRLLHKNSFLFTYSCSHHITEKQFEEILVKSAETAGRKIQIIDFANCTYDHPVLPQMPETKYLKGYILYIN
ncbi:MAG: class I SAM-dependent rRNA methyltransferase [Ignavibacteria bacterium]|nr:class I SAM-dependent rRNA methyltransferase [Ignavibacteria bacterium]